MVCGNDLPFFVMRALDIFRPCRAKGLEGPELVSALLDVERRPRKPLPRGPGGEENSESPWPGVRVSPKSE